MSDFETQAQIVHKSNQIREHINGLYEWEKDMKQKEAKRNATPDEEAFDQSYPLRNQIQPSKSSSVSAMQSAKPSTSRTVPDKPVENVKRNAAIPNAVENANEFKTRGNNCVKAGEYQKAVHYYTEAIRLNKSEAVYYTNRALCYLKQSKFTECIDDCTTAIGLDSKAVKAYYRRMQAREQMEAGDLQAALSDCKIVLRIEPKNADAQRSLVRLEGLLKASGKKVTKRDLEVEPEAKPVEWSQFHGKDGCERIDFVTKAPHLRSKQALKRIAISVGGGKTTPVAVVDSNRVNEKIKSSIDQTAESKAMTANNDSSKSTTDSNQTVAKATKATALESKSHVIPVELVIPKNSAQFHKTWMSIKDDEQKYKVLKGIYNAEIGKILGAQFNVSVLREILSVLKSHFVSQNLPIANILHGVVKNDQMPIISAMMNAEDKLAFTKLVEYMRIREEDAHQIDTIQKIFDDLISM